MQAKTINISGVSLTGAGATNYSVSTTGTTTAKITPKNLTGWPLTGTLLAGYGNAMPDGRRSEGLLIAAAAGAPVYSVAAGRVVYADWLKGYGMLMVIDHGRGNMSLYANNDALLKDVGESVVPGERIATVGTSGAQNMPSQGVSIMLLKPSSAKVGILGRAGRRCGVETAKARSDPDLSCATLVVIGSKRLSIWPLSKSCMAGALPW